LAKRIDSLIRRGESQSLEFKTSFGREAIESLCAFANTQGGTVLIGVKDSDNISGIEIGRETIQQWINQIRNSTSPSIIPDAEHITIKGKTVVMLSVISYPIKPVSFKGKYFKRVHSSNHPMDLNEIANEHLRTMNISWDFAQDPHHAIADISLKKVNRFIDMCNALRTHSISDDPLTVLRKFELLRESSISFGCFLLFCKASSILTTIDAGYFDSDVIIKDNITIREDLFTEVNLSMEFVRKHISKRMVITDKAQRDEIWEYPLEAVREIVINMVVHRDYQASADSTIKIFKDSIQFHNPGGLPQGISMKDILSGRIASMPRNKQIASIFKEAGIIEKYGSGIRRVRLIMETAGAPDPLFEVVGDTFKVTLFPIDPSNFGGVNGGANGGVNGGVNKLLEFIQTNPGKNARQLGDQLGVARRTLERHLKLLKGQGKIEFRGSPKTGGYYLK